MHSIHDMIEIGRNGNNPKAVHEFVSRNVVNRAVFIEHKKRQSCIGQALSRPLPGASADAFINGALKVNGRNIYEVVPTHIKCLQAVDSPLLKMGQEAAASADKKSDADFEENEQWELCYIFTQEPKQLRKNLKELGVGFIKKEAEKLVDEGGWNAAEISTTVMACIAQYVRHFQATLKFSQEMEASGDVSFFRELKAKP